MKSLKQLMQPLPLSQEIIIYIKEKFNSKVEVLLEDCIADDESAPYGDTYLCSGSFYPDKTVERCMESAKEYLIEEFKEDPEEFLSACEGGYDFNQVLNFINQL